MELIAGRAPERVLLVGADLRLNVERAQQREGASCNWGADQIEVHGDLAATAEMHAPGDVEEPRQLRESIAVRLGRDRRELVAEVVRWRHLRAPGGGACRRRRMSRTSRCHLHPRLDGTERTGRGGCVRRTSPRL